MKPLTAEDLVIGGKYVVKLYSEPSVCEYYGVQEKEYHFKGYPVSYFLTESDLATSVTPYTEPNQTTMNTEFTEQPFNLETALEHPEWVYFRNGEKPLEWHWFDKIKHPFPIRTVSSNHSFDSHNMHGRRLSDKIDNYDLILRVPYRTVWVNLFENKEAEWSDSEQGCNDGRTYDRIACVPVKIPAI